MENQHHIPWEQWLDRATAAIRNKPDQEEDRAELEAIVREKQKEKTYSAQNTHSAEEYAETGGEQNAADR